MNPDGTHTREELLDMIDKMDFISTRFYGSAINVGNHAFIEFTGLMNEYIKLCRDTVEAGGDFTQCSIHGGKPLAAQPFQERYIKEKLGCIFGTTFPDLTNTD